MSTMISEVNIDKMLTKMSMLANVSGVAESASPRSKNPGQCANTGRGVENIATLGE